MSEIINDKILEKYLLGLITEDKLLEQIEAKMADDEKFSLKVRIKEDDLIEQYINESLSNEKLRNFEKLFFNSPTRRKKIIYSQAIKKYSMANPPNKEISDYSEEKRNGFFDWFSLKPKLAYSFALPVVLLAIFGFWFLIIKGDDSQNYIAQIDSLYSSNRPSYARIVDFKYLPHSSIRGQKEEQNTSIKRKRRIIETKLLEEIENHPESGLYNNLGVYYLTERKYDEAIEQFQEAIRLSEDNTEARSNLSVAYLEKAKSENENGEKLKLRANAFEETTKAINSGDDRLELLFNKALILQEMNIPGQAIKAWKKYLEKDSKSKWADEARKNLKELETDKNTSFKTKEKIFDDFLEALKKKDTGLIWRIHSQTKEFNSQKFIPLQLTRKILETNHENDSAKSNTYLSALNYIGELESKKNADPFFSDLAIYYNKLDAKQQEKLFNAYQILTDAHIFLASSEYNDAYKKLNESKKLFESAGNILEAKILEVPISFALTRLGKLQDSNKLLANLENYSRKKGYKWLLTACLDWVSSNQLIDNEISKSMQTQKETLELSLKTDNVYEIQRISGGLSQIQYEFGETNNSLKNISRAISFDNLYNQSVMQAWRNYKHLSDLFNILGLHETAVEFGNEYLDIAVENKTNPAHIQLSQIFLAKAYFGKKDYKKTLELIESSKKIGSNLENDFQQGINSAFIKIMTAHINRREGKCIEAINDYDEAINIYSKLSENVLENYFARKGKLLCYQETNQQEKLEKELQLVLNSFEDHRRQIVEESYRNVYFDNEQTVYDIAIDFYLKKGDQKKAFEYSEKSKSRSLLDFLEDGAKITNDNITYNNVAKPLTLNEIQNKMPENVQLVQYAVLPSKIVVWIITKKGFDKVETVLDANELDKKIGDYLKLLKESRNKLEEIKSESDSLYKILIEPLIAKLDKEKDLFIIADKSLHRLPFASLYSEKSKKYLIEEYTIANTPSASIFIITTENAINKSEDESLISIGNPSFDKNENPQLDDLQAARKEAYEVAKYYSKNEQFIGDDATKENLLKNFDNASVLHFAGHYIANEKSPLNSKLLLSKTNEKEEGDLRVIEIANRKRNHLKLVVLSACQTDVEQYYNGEGSIGAARIFLAIGSPVVVASYYEVDSESTADLMINFHRLRKEGGLNVPEALRQAQIEAIHNNQTEKQSPYYWLAFSAIGGFSRY